MPKQKILEDLEAYPERPRLFALRYVQLLRDAEAVREVGPMGCWLLTSIALEEDKRFYRPVSFRNFELQALLGGRDEKTVIELRERLADAGWLYQRKGTRSRAAVFWVKVPDRFQETWQKLAGEMPSELTGKIPANPQPNASEPPAKTPAYIPIPSSNPKPASSTRFPHSVAKAPDDAEWAAVAAEIEEFGIGESAAPVAHCRAAQVPPALVREVLNFARQTGAWTNLGKVRRRLLTLRPGQRPSELRLWMPPDLPHRLRAFQTPRGEPEDVVKNSDRTNQLRLKYDAELRNVSTVEIADRFQITGHLRDFLTYAPRWQDIRSDDVKNAVVEIIAKHLEPAGRGN